MQGLESLLRAGGQAGDGGWAFSVVIAVGAVAGLGAIGFVRDFVPIGLAPPAE
jgi:hypothetical protein